MSKLTYSRSSLATALRSGGIGSGDTVLVHLDLAALGEAEGAPTPAGRNALVREALFDVVGPEGTILVPTYSFSFCRQQDFDPETTPAISGAWSPTVDFPEEFRKLPGAVRSRDPIHSVAGVGPRAQELLERRSGDVLRRGERVPPSSSRRREDLHDRARPRRGDVPPPRRGTRRRPVPVPEALHGPGQGERDVPQEGMALLRPDPRRQRLPGRVAAREPRRKRRGLPGRAGRRRADHRRLVPGLRRADGARPAPRSVVHGARTGGRPDRAGEGPRRGAADRGPPALRGRDGDGHRRRPLAPAAQHRVGRIRRGPRGPRRHGPDDRSRVPERAGGGDVDHPREVDLSRGVPRDARRPPPHLRRRTTRSTSSRTPFRSTVSSPATSCSGISTSTRATPTRFRSSSSTTSATGGCAAAGGSGTRSRTRSTASSFARTSATAR